MNDVTLFMLFIVDWLLSKPTLAVICSVASYQMSGHVLDDHVIQSFHGTSTSVSCLEKCEGNSSCHSINWYRKTGLCELNDGTHLSDPNGLVSDSTGSYMLYSPNPMVHCSSTFCSNRKICLMGKDGISYLCKDCQTVQTALGMEDGSIRDAQITASSYYYGDVHAPYRGRLHRSLSGVGWVASTTSVPFEWFKIDLRKMHWVTKVATQGRTLSDQWVTQYFLKFSQDGSNWEDYRYEGAVKYFQGNSDRNTVVAHQLPTPIQTKAVTFVPTSYTGLIAMRVELYGCPIL